MSYIVDYVISLTIIGFLCYTAGNRHTATELYLFMPFRMDVVCLKGLHMEKFNIDRYVNKKIKTLSNTDKTFCSIYNLMFRDGDYVMFEWTDGRKIKKMTYAQCREGIEKYASALSKLLSGVEKGKMVGLYGQNSIEWVQLFWAIMKCGYKPLLLNTKLSLDRLENTIQPYEVGAIISDSEKFEVDTIFMKDIVPDENPVDVNDWANELIVMSSGTSMKAKLCVYDGERFFYQLEDSVNIVKTCKPIKKHYEGNLKQLMFLPLYHIFGLAAMFMWFAFFARTFVLLKDQNPETIMFTIRKHKVTHIFAVPLFWEIVYKKCKATLKTQDEKTIKKVEKGLSLVRKTKSLWLGRKLFKQLREKIFGESICFLISGGSAISSEILTFFNSVGYHLANGYGMSEIGITSVELSSKFSNITDSSVGKPFGHVEYRIGEKGNLLVKAKSMAKDIFINGKREELVDGWYDTLDNAKEEKGRFFICGRADDMIVGNDGENINPAWFEKQIFLDGVEDVCILNINNNPTLLIQVGKYISYRAREKIKEKARGELVRLGIAGTVQEIAFTAQPLISGNEFKLNRKRLETIELLSDEEEKEGRVNTDATVLKLKELFANILGKKKDEIAENAHFFFDLKGNSLDYFSLISAIQNEFGVRFPADEGKSLYTVAEFYEFIQKNM